MWARPLWLQLKEGLERNETEWRLLQQFRDLGWQPGLEGGCRKGGQDGFKQLGRRCATGHLSWEPCFPPLPQSRWCPRHFSESFLIPYFPLLHPPTETMAILFWKFMLRGHTFLLSLPFSTPLSPFVSALIVLTPLACLACAFSSFQNVGREAFPA